MKPLGIVQVCLLLLISVIKAQPGKNGILTVNAPGQVLNRYSPVTNDIPAGTNTFVIAPGPLFGLCAGDLVMIYQAQGVSINTSNSSSYGGVTAYNGAGFYEFKYVQSVNGNTVTTQTTFTNTYSAAGRVQAVKVPQYSTLTINPGASIAAKNWKDTVILTQAYRFGGIVAIHASSIVNNGTITASGAGFRGGAYHHSPGITLGITAHVSAGGNSGGEKGEGVFGYQTDYDANGGRYCMGAAANGGGGGDAHNAGGGGGANGDNGNSWNGEGVMVVNSTNLLSAWSLSSAYIANGNSLTNSSGGGRGGYSYGDANANATIHGPGNSLWVGDQRREIGGLGGRPLTNISAEFRIYFGGGGGASHSDNNAVGAGGNGGGIVYLVSGTDITGSGVISSNGNSTFNSTGCHCDGIPGAGAGGSIVIKTNTISATQTVSAVGGKGGNQMLPVSPGNANESEGPGGGGGGGFIAVPGTGILPAVNGGLNGITLSNALAGEMTSNGATQGASGQTVTIAPGFITFSSSPSQGTYTAACTGAQVSLNPPVNGISYMWTGPAGYASNSPTPIVNNINVQNVGVYSITVVDNEGCQTLGTVSVSALPLPLLTVENKTVCPEASVVIGATGAITYTWSNTLNTSTILVTPASTTIYSVQGTGSNGCVATATLQVLVSTCSGLKEIKDPNGVLIYPNPAYGSVVVTAQKNLHLFLLNELGQVVKEVHLTPDSGYSAKITGLEQGVYFLSDANSNILNKFVVVE